MTWYDSFHDERFYFSFLHTLFAFDRNFGFYFYLFTMRHLGFPLTLTYSALQSEGFWLFTSFFLNWEIGVDTYKPQTNSGRETLETFWG